MLKDLSIYKDTKRNEKCPCGSGKIFKKCCMNEYRKAKKSLSEAKVSTFTPIPPLTKEEKDAFTSLYQSLLLFAYEYRNKGKTDPIDVKKESTAFLAEQREYFYEHCDEVIDAYIGDCEPDEEDLVVLNDIREAKFDHYYVLSKSEESAVIMDRNEVLYNIQALHSPLNEVLNVPHKYFLIQTALIHYKNRYIADGLFNAGSIPKELEEYFDTVPYKNPEIQYNRDNQILRVPLLLHVSLSSNIDTFEKMENLVLKKIPHAFTQGLIDLFENPYTYKINFISSFLRSTDLSSELNSTEGEQTFSYIIGGSPVINFEFGSKTDVISYETLEKYYRQKPMSESVSRESYEKAKDRGLLQNLFAAYSSFYTILGIAHLEEKHIDAFETFLESFKTREKREQITVGLVNVCDELKEKYNIEIEPVFLGLGTDLESIYDEIESYRQYMQQAGGNAQKAKAYSIHGGV